MVRVMNAMNRFLDSLQQTVLLRDGDGVTDGQLLDAFISRREDAAFAALVQRHGPMVWGVCRRLLANSADAEDAFQATFLILVRKATSVVPREMVANFLYGVACNVCRKARAATGRRRMRERQVANMPEPETVERDLWPELEPLLDQELNHLPDKYRVAIVLCDLEGKTRREAARQLNIPEGTLSSRLSTGRVLLAKRLAQRGVALSGGVLAVVLAQKATAAGLPKPVAIATIKAASLFAAGQATGVISGKVAALTEGVLKAMLLTKLKTVVATLLVVAVIGIGAGLLPCGPTAGQHSDGKQKAQKDAKAIQGTGYAKATDDDVPQPKNGSEAVNPWPEFKGEDQGIVVAVGHAECGGVGGFSGSTGFAWSVARNSSLMAPPPHHPQKRPR
jgi:RNA polymerase sigma factor (sigma-70 family)